MLFELSIHCIGPTEGPFIAALVVALLMAVLLARPLRRVLARFAVPWRRVYLTLTWAGVGATLFVVPLVLLHALYSALHPHVMLCTAFVWPAFLIAPVLLFFMARAERPAARRVSEPNEAHPSD